MVSFIIIAASLELFYIRIPLQHTPFRTKAPIPGNRCSSSSSGIISSSLWPVYKFECLRYSKLLELFWVGLCFHSISLHIGNLNLIINLFRPKFLIKYPSASWRILFAVPDTQEFYLSLVRYLGMTAVGPSFQIQVGGSYPWVQDSLAKIFFVTASSPILQGCNYIFYPVSDLFLLAQ